MHLFFVENTHLNSKQRSINIFNIHEAIFDTGCNYQYYMLIDRPSKNARSWIAYVFIWCSRKPFNKYVNLRIVNFFTINFFSNISIGRQLTVAPFFAFVIWTHQHTVTSVNYSTSLYIKYFGSKFDRNGKYYTKWAFERKFLLK